MRWFAQRAEPSQEVRPSYDAQVQMQARERVAAIRSELHHYFPHIADEELRDRQLAERHHVEFVHLGMLPIMRTLAISAVEQAIKKEISGPSTASAIKTAFDDWFEPSWRCSVIDKDGNDMNII